MTYLTDYYDEMEVLDEFDTFDNFYAFDELEGDDFDDLDYLDEFDESDEFLGQLSSWWKGLSPSKRKWAGKAARAAISAGTGAAGAYLGNRYKGKAGAIAGGTFGHGLGRLLGSYIPEDEFDAMDYLAEMAVVTEDEDEAEAFLGALVPLAARLLPRLGGGVTKVIPHLVSGVSRVAKTLRSNPNARRMIRSLPGIVRNTTRDVARHYSRQGNISGKTAAKYLAHRTYQGLNRRTASARKLPKPITARKRLNVPTGYSRSRIIRGPQGYCQCYYR